MSARTMGIVTLLGVTEILRNEVSDPVWRVKTETPVFPFFPKRVVEFGVQMMNSNRQV